MPTKVLITLAIILGVALGTGTLIFGVLMAVDMRDETAAFIAGGSTLLAASAASLVAHLAGGFRDLDEREP